MRFQDYDSEHLPFWAATGILAVVGTVAIARWAASEALDHLSKKIGIM